MTGDYAALTTLRIADDGASAALEPVRLEVEMLEAIHRGLSDNPSTAGDPRVHVQSALEALDRCMDSLKEMTR